MQKVSLQQLEKNSREVQQQALREPLVLTEADGTDKLVLMSVEEYARLRASTREVLRVGDLPDDVIEALRDARMDPKHAHLDRLMD